MRRRQNNSDTDRDISYYNDSDTDKKDWTLTVTRTYTGTDTDTHARASASNPHHRGPSKNVNFLVRNNSECACPTSKNSECVSKNVSAWSVPARHNKNCHRGKWTTCCCTASRAYLSCWTVHTNLKMFTLPCIEKSWRLVAVREEVL